MPTGTPHLGFCSPELRGNSTLNHILFCGGRKLVTLLYLRAAPKRAARHLFGSYLIAKSDVSKCENDNDAQVG